MLNLHSYPVVIRQDSVVRQLEPMEVESTIFRCENPTERDNFSAARRVLFRDGSAPLHKASRVTEGLGSSFAQKILGPLAPLLEHRMGLYECHTEGKTEYEKTVIHWLLLKHQEAFSQNENDLCWINLVQHTIGTGGAKAHKAATPLPTNGICG